MPPKRVGRPPHSQEKKKIAKQELRKAIGEIGHTAGWRPMSVKLLTVPIRLIQWGLAELKLVWRRKERRRIARRRKGTEVLVQGAIIAQDSTHTGSCRGHMTFAELLKDPGPLSSQAEGDGKAITGKGVIKILEGLKAKGLLSLVWASDNGPAYICKEVAEWLKQNMVIHLRSRTYQPEDNATAERGIQEDKAEARLGKGMFLRRPMQGVLTLKATVERLNLCRPRMSKGGKTSQQLTQEMPWWYTRVSRQEFYQKASAAMQAATLDLTGRAARAAERDAIFRTLELFGLILRTTGDQRKSYAIPERIS
jgi:hypothetical protein